MAVKAESFKNWCVENISPQCWPRVLLKSIDTVRAHGLNIKELENPPADLELSDDLLEVLNNSLNQIYDVQIEEGVLK